MATAEADWRVSTGVGFAVGEYDAVEAWRGLLECVRGMSDKLEEIDLDGEDVPLKKGTTAP